MEFEKTLMFLLMNLVLLVFNLAQESGAGSVSKTVGLADATHSGFPFGFMFGESGKTVEITQKEVSEYVGDDADFDGNKARAVYWIPTTCDSFAERGYTCLACGESLHCMAGNFALKAICGGRRPFCNNGVCSDIRGSKCRNTEPINRPSGAYTADENDVEHVDGVENVNGVNATLT